MVPASVAEQQTASLTSPILCVLVERGTRDPLWRRSFLQDQGHVEGVWVRWGSLSNLLSSPSPAIIFAKSQGGNPLVLIKMCRS